MNLPPVKILPQFIRFNGGYDETTPPWEIPSGTAKRSQNVYQGENGGFYTFPGYERYDGQPAPSSAIHSTITALDNVVVQATSPTSNFLASTGLKTFTTDTAQAFVVGAPVIAAYNSDPSNKWMSGKVYSSSGATLVINVSACDGTETYTDWVITQAAIAFDATVSIGATLTDGSETATVISVGDRVFAITDSSGDFSAAALYVGTDVVGVATGAQDIDTGETAALRAYYKSLAADALRADITAVPGAGPVLGDWHYGGKWYAFRNNTLQTAAAMYVAEAAGWTLVPLGREISFTSGGTYEVKAGDTIVGETSTATGVVSRVILVSGTFAAGNAAGRIFISAQTGTFSAETIKVGTNLNIANVAGNSTAIAFSIPSGRFKFGNYNFTGSAGTLKMYGVDGLNRGFEFDGTVMVPISTGMTVDAPDDLIEFKNHLCYAFGASFQHSSPGQPYVWSVVIGAGEIALGDNITGFKVLPGAATGGALGMFSKDSSHVLYGNSVADWNLIAYKNEVGAIQDTIQQIGRTFFLSQNGIVDFSTSQEYGNFQDSVVSDKIKDFLSTHVGQVTASCVVRAKNQYWLFFADKKAICSTIVNGRVTAMMPMEFPHKVVCASSCETSTGEERVMVGSDNGFVYEMFKGTSFDGAELEWYFELAEDHFGSALVEKRFRVGTLEVKGSGYAEFYFSSTLAYNDANKLQPTPQGVVVDLQAPLWDVFTWDLFSWDGTDLVPLRFPMRGIATNVSIILRGISNYFSPLQFSGCIVQYTPTRITR